MTGFLITREHYSAKENTLAPCEEMLISELEGLLQNVDARSAIKGRSVSLKKAIAESISNSDRPASSRIRKLEKTSAFHENRLGNAGALFELDLQSECDKSCGHFHRVNAVLCLNNREAVGSNFLKLELAAQELIRYNNGQALTDENVLGVLVSLNKKVLTLGGWDPAYANSTDYTFAFSFAYSSMLRSRILALKLDII
jgi:hypothetical protein